LKSEVERRMMVIRDWRKQEGRNGDLLVKGYNVSIREKKKK
jgi:hypothetical protein